MNNRLTKLQKHTYDWIKQFVDTNGYPPSLAELADYYKISVTSIIDRLDAMEKKGCIKRADNISRGIQLLTPNGNSKILAKT